MPRGKDLTPIGSLHSVTRELLCECGETPFDVAVATGLSHSWLVAFRYDRMHSPSVSKVQLLYEYLTGKPLLRVVR